MKSFSFLTLLSLFSSAIALKEGEYAAPEAGAARSACPMLNTLANHGYLPRNGSAFNREKTREVFDRVLNTDSGVTDFFFNAAVNAGMTDGSPETISLSSINVHGNIEHDISLVREDIALGNPLLINQTMVENFAKFASDGKGLAFGDIGAYRKARFNEQKARNPGLTFGVTEQVIASGEAAIMFLTFEKSGRIPVSTIKTFLGQEKLPEGYSRPKSRIGVPKLATQTLRMRLAS
jgi:hypothetical protein